MNPLIELQEWQALSSQKDVILVDARGGPDAKEKYLDGHLPGAIFVDVETQLSEKKGDAAQGGRHPLPQPQLFVKLLSELGITRSTQVVVYDDKMGANAACRFWWMLRGLGHSMVRVLNGGFTYAVSQGMTLQKGWVQPRPVTIAVNEYPMADWEQATVNMTELVQGLADQSCLLVDVREAFRYQGESEPIDLVAGHIPGAMNIPYLENLQNDGRFAAIDELQSIYRPLWENAGQREVILHCGSGVSACHTLMALQIAQLPIAKLYVGSWSEWSRNDLPMVTQS